MPKTKQQKREEAEARRAAYEARTMEEQVTLIAQRPGQSVRERERMGTLMSAKEKEERQRARKEQVDKLKGRKRVA